MIRHSAQWPQQNKNAYACIPHRTFIDASGVLLNASPALHYFDLAGSDANARVPGPVLIWKLACNLMATVASWLLTPWAFAAHKRRAFNSPRGTTHLSRQLQFLGWGSAMFGLYRNLKARGAQNVYLLRIPFPWGAIDRMADALTQEFEKLSAQIGGQGGPTSLLMASLVLQRGWGPRKIRARSPRQPSPSRHLITAPNSPYSCQDSSVFSLSPVLPLIRSLDVETGDCTLTFIPPTDNQIIPAHLVYSGKRGPKPAGLRPLEYPLECEPRRPNHKRNRRGASLITQGDFPLLFQ